MPPSLSCHIKDRFVSDVQIAFDSELPRCRCTGSGPNRHTVQRQKFQQSFGTHRQRCILFFNMLFYLFIISQQIVQLLRTVPHDDTHTFGT